MSDTESVAMAQRAFWNSEATRRWVTEQTRIDRLMSNVAEAALVAAAPMPGESVLEVAERRGRTLKGWLHGGSDRGQKFTIRLSTAHHDV
jgi:hypothetical protein